MRPHSPVLLAAGILLASLARQAAAQAPAPAAGNARDAAHSTFRRALRIVPLAEAMRGLPRDDSDPRVVLLEKLNRRDLDHLLRLRTAVAPDSFVPNPLSCSPLPLEYAYGDSMPKLIVVHQPAQVFGAYQNGRLVRWGPVSTGRKDDRTPTGLFHLNWKSKGRPSTVDPKWFLPWYFNIESRAGISFHQYELPGRPASHACIRMLAGDAEWLYFWGEQWRLGPRPWIIEAPGTPVLILGKCTYADPPLWRTPEFLARGIDLPAAPDTLQDWSGVGAPE